jgi:capsular polysaccharide transport system permease protein
MARRDEFAAHFARLAETLDLTDRRDRVAIYRFSRGLLRSGLAPDSNTLSPPAPGRTYMELDGAIREWERSLEERAAIAESDANEGNSAVWQEGLVLGFAEGGGEHEPVAGASGGILHSARLLSAIVVRMWRANSARDPMSYVMMFVTPTILIGVHFWAYLIVFRSGAVLGMPVLPFLIIGIAGWYLFRMMYLQMSIEAMRARNLVMLPGVNMLTILTAKGLEITGTYTIWVGLALCVVTISGGARPPVNLLMVMFYWSLLALSGFGFGLLANAMRDIFPAFNHLLIVVFRIGFWVSGVVFVSEQMSQPIRGVLIWNPLLHIMQLLRSFYFPGYRTQDGNPLYAILFVLTILCVGLVAEQLRTTRVRAIA